MAKTGDADKTAGAAPSRKTIVKDLLFISPKSTCSTRIVEQIKTKVRDLLAHEQARPGDYLGTEADFVGAFGTSRVPVRDALQALQALGLLDVRVGKAGGVFIAQPDPEKFEEALAIQAQLLGATMEEIFDDQEAIESLAAELAARRIRAQDIDRLTSILQDFECEHEKKNYAAMAIHGMAFHTAIAEISGNRILIVQTHVLMRMVYDFYTTAPQRSHAMGAEVLKYHRRLLEHLRAGNAVAAREHIPLYVNWLRERYRKDSHGALPSSLA